MAAVGGRAMAMAPAALLAAVLAGALAWAGAARAEQDIFSAYPELLTRTHPAPLLATFLPPALGPAGALELNAAPEGGARYSMTYNRIIPAAHPGLLPKLAADMSVKLLPERSLAAARRRSQRFYRFSSATVRGHPGLLLRPKHGTTTGYLWSEGGHVYEIATATPHTLSLAELLGTSRTLGHLQSDLFGQDTIFMPGQTVGGGAVLLVTDVAVIANVNWTAPCTERSNGLSGGAGSSTIVTLPLSGGSFSLPPTSFVSPTLISEGEPSTWTVSVSGSISGAGGTLAVAATGESASEACSLAPAASSLAPNPDA